MMPSMAHSTVVRFYKKVRAIISQKMSSLTFSGSADGNCEVIEIDESLFGRKQKYQKGRYTRRKWVFGMVERNTRKCYFTEVADRTTETLVPLIKEKVSPNHLIYSDDWPAYRNLKAHGFRHEVVVHSREFVSDEGVCTNNIEGII